MRNIRFEKMFYVAIVCLFVVGLASSAFGQGKGGGGGRSSGGGAGNGGGPPAGVGADRGLGNASGRSNGRSDAGLDRARLAADNSHQADKDLREHPGISNTLHVNANSLRAGYKAALVVNPNLKFGQYVAATRLEQNLHSRFPNITRDAILAGLASGDSLGRTLHNLGLSSHEADEAKKQAEQEIKRARK